MQVRSRSLGAAGSHGLLPFVDLLNHSAESRPPMLELGEAGELVVTVLPMRDDDAAPLAAGDELVIAYAGEFTPLEAFIKFGFVPQELWAPRAGA